MTEPIPGDELDAIVAIFDVDQRSWTDDEKRIYDEGGRWREGLHAVYRHRAAKIRALLTVEIQSGEQHCPTCMCERRAPVQYSRNGGEKHGIKYGPHGGGTIAWAEHEQAWAVYGARYSGQSAQRIAERGGFGYGELVEFLGHEPTTWRAYE